MNIPSRPWTNPRTPKRILVIRLQATGDVVITLPYLQHLRNTLPADVRLDFLTRVETRDIPRSLELFDRVFSIGGARSRRKQLFYAILLLPKLALRRYQVVIDLQNNGISRIVRKMLRPEAWSAFDRFSPEAAGERNRLTIEAIGLGGSRADGRFQLKAPAGAIDLLKNHGWNGKDPLLILNPAGAFKTRNWDPSNYVQFARLWLGRFPDTRFLILGTAFIAEKAAFIRKALHPSLIDLTRLTTPAEAFALIQKATLLLSEDSGLMHMAWVSGIPTIVLFGSTRSDWSRPLGPHTFFLDSSDLPCGNCMQSVCRFGDTHCLTRITPDQVFRHSLTLLNRPV